MENSHKGKQKMERNYSYQDGIFLKHIFVFCLRILFKLGKNRNQEESKEPKKGLKLTVLEMIK